jgi:isoquinoline 1-oxidoreductase subunit beta
MSDPISPQTTEITETKPSRWRMTRRGFLIGAGAVLGSVAVAVVAGRAPFYRFMAGMLDNRINPNELPSEPTVWLEITPDNQVIVYSPKVEMGQGIHTAVAQLAAEELETPWQNIQVRQASTHTGPFDSTGTSASGSVVSLYVVLPQTAATMRELLRQEGARLLGLSLGEVTAVDGQIQATANPSQSLTYGQIVSQVTTWPELANEPTLKPASQYKIIGNSLPRVDLPAKIAGEAVYGYDARLPNMLYGAVARPPTIGAKLLTAEPGNAPTMLGVEQVVIDVAAGFAGVVARTRQQANTAVRELRLTWDEGRLWQQSEIEALLSFDNGDGVNIQQTGRAVRLDDNSASLTAEYFTPFAAHAHLEAQAALADVQGDKVTIWGSTQSQASVQNGIANALDLPKENITVTPTYLGGGFGRKLNIEAATEAARLSRAVGRPVHVGWSRTEDMQNGYVRPITRSRFRARLDNRRIAEMAQDQASGKVAFSFFPPFLQTIFGSDFAAWRGAMNFYSNIPNRSTTTYLPDLPIRTGWWRGLGLFANTFAQESFIDELAHLAQADPLQFRLAHLGDDALGQRMAGVLQAAAQKAGWGQPLPDGHAHGIACCTDVDTVVAQVAEISVDRATGQIQVHKVVSAVDAGLFINPDGAIAQTQGAIVMGLSSTLLEELTVADGQIVPTNFTNYPLLTLDMTPEIEVILLESDGQPRGMGEPPIGPIGAAVGNALYALTGIRLRRLPFKPETVLAALPRL